jgi:hypothetical protein
LFFSGYVFVTLLPVIFLVNHRFEFFWYIPFFGIAGLAAVFAGSVERALRKRMPLRTAAATGLVLFAVLGAVHYSREKQPNPPFPGRPICSVHPFSPYSSAAGHRGNDLLWVISAILRTGDTPVRYSSGIASYGYSS